MKQLMVKKDRHEIYSKYGTYVFLQMVVLKTINKRFVIMKLS